jgi:hypothetical protein
MGGYAIDLTLKPNGERRPELSDFSFGEYSRLTPTPAGILYLIERQPELFPSVSQEAIEDKSNANGLAKFLVCAKPRGFACSVSLD